MNRSLVGIGLVVMLAGCQSGTFPDPNDPADVGTLQPEVLMNNLKGASQNLNERKAKGEIDDKAYKRYISEYARKLLASVKIESVPPERYWEYAEVYRTAELWPETEVWARRAVKAAKNQDRRVNDSLHLAQALANLNRVPEAIQVARSVFDTPPNEKAPIITAVLLELVPAASGKGSDIEVAKLLEDAIQQAHQTVVDGNSEAGKMYLMARPHHVNNAWHTVINLYRMAGRDDLADAAAKRATQDESLTREA